MAQAYAWSARIVTISLEMVLPAMVGFWIDCKLGTWIVFLVLGSILGMTAGMIHLLRLAAPAKEGPLPGETSTKNSPKR